MNTIRCYLKTYCNAMKMKICLIPQSAYSFFYKCPLAPTTRLVGKGVTKKRKAFHRSGNLAMYLFSPLPPILLPKPPLDAEENLKLQGRRISVLESPSHRTLFQPDHSCCYIGVCDHLLVK